MSCISSNSAILEEFNKVACERRGLMNIRCDENHFIKILAANFGRTQPDSEVCPAMIPQKDETDCISDTAKSKVADLCDGSEWCSAAPSPFVFGDPCPLTYKYLNVTYTCMREYTLDVEKPLFSDDLHYFSSATSDLNNKSTNDA
jgi:hypothetical protein